nr:MAG TPA: hypothetical protein [Caudoviricetes sp.]
MITINMTDDEPRLTDKEAELIRAIRNLKRSYPNGYKNLKWYILNLVDELIEIH